MKRKQEEYKYKFVAGPGAPFSNKDAEVFGPALLALATEFQVNGIRYINKRILYDYIEKLEEGDPLRRFVFSESDEEAARARRLELCGVLIRYVRIYEVSVKVPYPRPLFVHTRAPIVEEGSLRVQPTHVFRPDLNRFDSTLVNAAAAYIKRIRDAFGQLEHLTGDFPEIPRGIRGLVVGLRAVLDHYDQELTRSDNGGDNGRSPPKRPRRTPRAGVPA